MVSVIRVEGKKKDLIRLCLYFLSWGVGGGGGV